MNLSRTVLLGLAIVTLVSGAASQMTDNSDTTNTADAPSEMMAGANMDMRMSAESLAASRFGPAVRDDIDDDRMVTALMLEYAEDEHTGDFRLRDHAATCPDTEAMADAVWDELWEQNIPQDRPFCKPLEQRADRCLSQSKKTCEKILSPHADDTDDQVMMACPPNRSQMQNFCVRQATTEMEEEHREESQEMCEERWEAQKERCDELTGAQQAYDELNNISNDDLLSDQITELEQQLAAAREENDTQTVQELEQQIAELEEQQEQQSEFTTTESGILDNMTCTKDEYMSQCQNEMETRLTQVKQDITQQCQQQAGQMVQDAQRMCQERNETYQTCMDHREKACSFATEAADTCRTMPEDKLYDVLVDRAEFVCDMRQEITQNTTVGKIISSMEASRDALPREHRAALDEDTQAFLNATKNIEAVEERESSRGITYDVKRVIGLAAKQEQKDIADLRDSIEQLNKTITSLEGIARQTSDGSAQERILNQVERLKDRRDELQQKVAEKQSRARGILSIFS